MNLASLGAVLALVTKDNETHRETVTTVVNLVQTVVDKATDVSNEVIRAYEQAGGTWSDLEYNDAPDYHCNTCKAASAPVEELTAEEMFNFLVDHAQHISAGRREALEILGETTDVSAWSRTIKQWFIEEREAKKLADESLKWVGESTI